MIVFACNCIYFFPLVIIPINKSRLVYSKYWVFLLLFIVYIIQCASTMIVFGLNNTTLTLKSPFPIKDCRSSNDRLFDAGNVNTTLNRTNKISP